MKRPGEPVGSGTEQAEKRARQEQSDSVGESVRQEEHSDDQEEDDDEEDDDDEDDDDEDDDDEDDDDEDENDDYEKIQMTQRQFDSYLVELNGGYKSLTKEMKRHRTEIARDGNIAKVTENLQLANSLYENSQKLGDSHHQNELTNMDSKAIKEIGEQASMGINNINLGVAAKGLEISDFLTRIAVYAREDSRLPHAPSTEDVDTNDIFYHGDMTDGDLMDDFYATFNWNKVSALYMKTSVKIPTIDFMMGPLGVEIKARRRAIANRDYEKSGEAAKPNAVRLEELTNSNERDTYQSAIHCYDILREKNDDEPINLFKFFINPYSFSKSIENLFYMSFLINHNKLLLYKNDEGIPHLVIPEAVEKVPSYISAGQKNKDGKSHLIFKLEYDTWLKLIEKYDIKNAFLGNAT